MGGVLAVPSCAIWSCEGREGGMFDCCAGLTAPGREVVYCLRVGREVGRGDVIVTASLTTNCRLRVYWLRSFG